MGNIYCEWSGLVVIIVRREVSTYEPLSISFFSSMVKGFAKQGLENPCTSVRITARITASLLTGHNEHVGAMAIHHTKVKIKQGFSHQKYGSL